MKPRHAILAGALALTACGDPDANVVDNGAAPEGEVSMLPGKYEIDFVREVMVAGQPREPTHESESQCFSADELRHPEGIFLPASDSCRQEEARASKGEFSARMICDIPEFSSSNVLFEVHGTYDRDRADLTGEANVDGATLHETRTFKRQGDC